MTRLRYVRNDRLPSLRISLELGSSPVDVSAVGVTVRAHVRVSGSATLKETLTGTKQIGRRTAVDADTGQWTVNTAAPYDVAGVGGIVTFQPSATTFDAAGTYEVEYEIDWGSSIKQTIYATDQVLVREDFA